MDRDKAQVAKQLLDLQTHGIASIFFRYQDQPPKAVEHVVETCSDFLGAVDYSVWEIDRTGSGEPIIRRIIPPTPVDSAQCPSDEGRDRLLRDLPELRGKRLSLGCRVHGDGDTSVLRIPFERREYVLLFELPHDSEFLADHQIQLELRAVGDLLQDAIVKAMCRYVGRQRANNGDFSLDNIFFRGPKLAGYLFADIRGFTTLCDALVLTKAEISRYPNRPELATIEEILEEFSSRVGQVVFEYGRLERIKGDGVLAIMGDMEGHARAEQAPFDSRASREYRRQTCVKGMACAIHMQAEFERLVGEWRDKWLDIVRMRRSEDLRPRLGIGIGFGEARFGFVGTDDHWEYSADGAHVNYAHRLGSRACKPMGAGEEYEEILLSQPMVTVLDEEDRDEVVRRHSIVLEGSNVEHAAYGIRRGTTKRPYFRFWEKLKSTGQDVGVDLPKYPWEGIGDYR